MSNDGIARWKKTIDAAPGFDAFESMVEEVLDAPTGGAAKPPPHAGHPPAALPSDQGQPTQPTSAVPRSTAAVDDFDAMVQEVLDDPEAGTGLPPSAVRNDPTEPTNAKQPRAAIPHTDDFDAMVQEALDEPPEGSRPPEKPPHRSGGTLESGSNRVADTSPEVARRRPAIPTPTATTSPRSSSMVKMPCRPAGSAWLAGLVCLATSLPHWSGCIGYGILHLLRPDKFQLPW